MARHRDVTMQSLDRRPCRDIEITLRFKRSDRENTSTNGSCLTAQRLQIQVDGLAPLVRSARIPPRKQYRGRRAISESGARKSLRGVRAATVFVPRQFVFHPGGLCERAPPDALSSV